MIEERPDQMETLLKAYAEKRRQQAGPPLELHPATRELLQAEVRRQYRPKTAGASSWLALLRPYWPRIISAVGIFLVLGIISYPLWRTENRFGNTAFLAKHEVPAPGPVKAPALERAPKPAAEKVAKELAVTQPALDPMPPAPFSPSRPASESLVKAKTRNAPDAMPRTAMPPPAVSAPMPAPVDTPTAAPFMAATPNPTSRRLGGAMASGGGEAQGLARKRSASPEPAQPGNAQPTDRAANYAMVDKDTLDSARLKQSKAEAAKPVVTMNKFAATRQSEPESIQPASAAPTAPRAMGAVAAALSLARAAAQDPVPQTFRARMAGTASPVMERFTLEQRADRVRIVDADGSVYESDRPLATAALRADANALKAVSSTRYQKVTTPQPTAGVRAEDGSVALPSATSFRLVGTNQTLQLRVVILGKLVPVANTTNQQMQGQIQLGEQPACDFLATPVPVAP
ncbi:MAG: hypothetical protein WCO56_15835 [Verrucomicrobiota bacterium]